MKGGTRAERLGEPCRLAGTKGVGAGTLAGLTDYDHVAVEGLIRG